MTSLEPEWDILQNIIVLSNQYPAVTIYRDIFYVTPDRKSMGDHLINLPLSNRAGILPIVQCLRAFNE
jgi:hypothetical protein